VGAGVPGRARRSRAHQARGLVRRPERGAQRDRPVQPEDERQVAGLHQGGARVLCQRARRRLLRLVPLPVSGRGGG